MSKTVFTMYISFVLLVNGQPILAYQTGLSAVFTGARKSHAIPLSCFKPENQALDQLFNVVTRLTLSQCNLVILLFNYPRQPDRQARTYIQNITLVDYKL